MAYTKKTWVCDELITAEDLNRMEDGIEESLECCGSGGDIMVVQTDWDDGVQSLVTDYTYEEIQAAGRQGKVVMMNFPNRNFAGAPFLLTAVGLRPEAHTFTRMQVRAIDDEVYSLDAMVAKVDTNSQATVTGEMNFKLTPFSG